MKSFVSASGCFRLIKTLKVVRCAGYDKGQLQSFFHEDNQTTSVIRCIKSQESCHDIADVACVISEDDNQESSLLTF